MNIKFGDYVKTERRGHVGRVIKLHNNFFDTGNTRQWYRLQKLGEHFKYGKWVSILCRGRGSVLVPLSECKKITKIALNNPYEKHYFGL